MAADIHDEQSGVLVVERKNIEKVARKAMARNIPPCHMRGWERHVGSRKERLLHLGRRLQIADHLRVDLRDAVVELGEFGVGPLQIVAGDREILIGDDQFLILGDGVLERRDKQIEHLLAAGLHTKLLAGKGHLQRGRLGVTFRPVERRCQQRLDTAEQEFRLVGFRDVVVCTGVETSDDVDRIGQRRQEDERQGSERRVGLHRLAKLIAGHHRHLDVGDDDVRSPLADQSERVGAGLAPAHDVAGLGEPPNEHLRLDAAVFRDHDVDT